MLPFIHVAHFAELLVAKFQCGDSGVVGSRGCRLPRRTLVGFDPSTSEASEALGRCPCSMIGRQSAREKSSVGAAFYPCCALCRTLRSEGSVLGSVGSSGVGDVVYPGEHLWGSTRPLRRRQRRKAGVRAP